MTRVLPSVLGLLAVLLLSACGGDTCESVQQEIQELGMEIQKDPKKALDESTAKDLESLRDKLVEMDCLGG